jgi:hypothetical protein
VRDKAATNTFTDINEDSSLLDVASMADELLPNTLLLLTCNDGWLPPNS